ncbi:succinic semialdehyde dehydrogenase [Streptomyces sp. KAU_LT]|uniref:succinic semialdehyde dehydrogenase n=1 Tax=Streptomyces sp. KAU_LT TaxID=3046669 RepID=UPI0024B6A9AF|nr:succinic semialdehyde dehydrogenase [Streptomyces sp. KAU_LT]MDI9834970.1 succinic semialdehyde dehydrogenase [Streptomyces sp. KAU_LT]
MITTSRSGTHSVNVAEPRLDPALVERLTAGVSASAEPTTTRAPFTGAPLAQIPQSTAADVNQAFAAARVAQVEWARLTPKQRALPFARFHDVLLSRQEEILNLLQWETGKARHDAFDEVMEAATASLYAARQAPKVLRTRRRQGAFPVFTRALESFRPKGVVTVITPWNYPLALGLDAIPALLAGNAVVHKPDTQTALSTLWPRLVLEELGLPKGLWQVVLGEPSVIGDALIDGADFVSFTGSTRAGRSIAGRAAERLIGCSLELGGKNPMVVLDDADLDAAAESAVRGCFGNSGQMCVGIERIYVHANVYDGFLARFASRVERMTLRPDFDFATDMGSLTNSRQLAHVQEHVEAALAAGARVVTGGRVRPDLGPLFYEPTILTGVPEDTPVRDEETFGPVVSVYRVDSDDEAVLAANDSPYGLNAAVYGRSEARARTLAARIQAGTVNINEGYASAYASQGASMGGMKSSGVGRRHGPAGLVKYTEPQTVASQRLLGFDPPFGMSRARQVALFTTSLRILKMLRIR